LRVIATIEARMSSTRLPGKVMLCLAGKPMIERKLDRVKRALSVHSIKVLTSIESENKIISDFCNQKNILCFEGSEDDILDRILKGTMTENADVVVQLTGDNPLIEPKLIDDCVNYLLDNKLDYVSNSISQRLVIGLNVRCFTRDALSRASRLCSNPMLRVHGGYFIQTLPEEFKIGENPVDKRFLRDDIRLTVDEPSDFKLVEQIFLRLEKINKAFSAEDILLLLDSEPDLKELNKSVRQKDVGEG